MKKKIIILVGILVTMILLSNIVTYAIAKKDLISFFFNDNGSTTKVDTRLLNKSSQKIVIDEYTISLEESLCEKNTQLGYLVFSVKKSNGRPEADIKSDGILYAFGKNNRFIFDYEATGSFNKVAEYVGDTLYVYISFEANKMDNNDFKLSECVNIMDYTQKVGDEYKHYTFDLQYSDTCKVFKANEGILYISPLGCKFVSAKKIDKLNIEIKKLDSDIVLNKKAFGEAGHREEKLTEIHYTSAFEKLLDLSEINEVLLNNQNLVEIK